MALPGNPRPGLMGHLTRGIARLARDLASLPPPRIQSPAHAGSLRRQLDLWWHAAPSRFRRLLLEERPMRARRQERPLVDALLEAGLIQRLAPSLLVPCARVFPFEGRYLATDLRARAEPDQVFSLMFEQVYFVRHIDVRPADRVLEIGVGSGVNALFAARSARSVTAVDINPRALAFARFNEALEPGEVPLDLRLGSLTDPIAAHEHFDLLLNNPPFEPVPPGTTWFLHSAGGADGLDLVRALLAKAPTVLAPTGRLEMITWSPGGDGLPLVVELFQRALPDARLEVHYLLDEPLESVLQRFSTAPGYAAWRRDLLERGLTRLYFVFVRATRGGPPELVELQPSEAVAAAQDAAAPFA